MRSEIVYRLNCLDCEKQSIRHLCKRREEDADDIASGVCKHAMTGHRIDWKNMKILDRAKGQKRLHLKGIIQADLSLYLGSLKGTQNLKFFQTKFLFKNKRLTKNFKKKKLYKTSKFHIFMFLLIFFFQLKLLPLYLPNPVYFGQTLRALITQKKLSNF